MKLVELLKLMHERKAPKKIKFMNKEFKFIKNDEFGNYIVENGTTYEMLSSYDIILCLNDFVEIIEEVEDKIEIPQEFLSDVNQESEIVLIKDNIGHDTGYKNSIGFLTDKLCLDGHYVFAFDKRANRWWECRFDKDDYIKTGLFVSDLIYKPFKVEDKEYEDIEEIKEFTYNATFDERTEILNQLTTTINALIRNQKKIIERLDK